MSDVKRLLSEATPLPWGPVRYALGISLADTEEDYALIVYAVNRLPAYEAAVEALESVLRFVQPEYLSDEGAIDSARATLARLRDEVPA